MNNLENKKSISLIDIIAILLKYKKKIIGITILSLIISTILYFFVFDLIFTSTASVKSTSKGGGLLSAIEGGIPDIGGLDDLGVGGGKSAKELAAYENILLSRRCLEPLIVKFNLMQRDDIEFMDDALKEFRENKLKITYDKIAGIMYISVLDKDKVLAKEMVEFLLEQLNSINIEMNVLNAKNNREFIEKRYYQSKEDLSKIEDSIKSFQLIYGVAPDLQIKASAQSVFTLEAELKSEEVKLDVLRKILSSDQPEVKVQQEKVNSIKNQISLIQNSTDLNDVLRLGNSPNIILSYLRLQRDLEIQTKILTFVLPIYEQAKIEEKRETPSVIVLDKPTIADKKTKPKRATMVIVFTFLGFVVSLISFTAYERLKEQFKTVKFNS